MGHVILTVLGMVAQMERRFDKGLQRERIERAKVEGRYVRGRTAVHHARSPHGRPTQAVLRRAVGEAPMIEIEVDASPSRKVSGLVRVPPEARAAYVVAHGAGAGMTHPFMAAVADGLFARGIATLRYQFPYMEQRTGRPDRPALAQATVRAAVATATRELPGLPLFAGGKSFGGRMTSQAQAEAPLPEVRGLAFLGFPLHPAKKPSVERAGHLAEVAVPMLFLQGTRDALAEITLVGQTVAGLEPRASLHVVEGGDHSFHVPARSGRSDAEAMAEMLDALAGWIDGILHASAT